MQLGSEQFQSSLENFLSVIPFVINMMNNVHSLPMVLPTDFTDCNSLGIYRGNIAVGKICRYISDGSIPSVFLFVFINFLVVY